MTEGYILPCSVADGPKGPPELKLSYDGYPGPVHHEEEVTATCKVRHGGDGTLVWVAYFPFGPAGFLYNDTKGQLVKSFSGRLYESSSFRAGSFYVQW